MAGASASAAPLAGDVAGEELVALRDVPVVDQRSCWYGCQRTGIAPSQWKNEGSAKYPRWSCPACYLAAKCVSRQAKTEAERESLKARRRDVDTYKADIVRLSKLPASSSRNSARINTVKCYVEQTVHFTSARDEHRVLWMDQDWYLGWAVRKNRAKDHAAAKDQWDTMESDQSWPREISEDGVLTLAVRLPKLSVGASGTDHKRTVQKRESGAGMDEAFAKRARVAQQLAFSDPALECTAGVVFRGVNNTRAGAATLALQDRCAGGSDPSENSAASGSGAPSANAAALRIKYVAEARKVLQSCSGPRSPGKVLEDRRGPSEAPALVPDWHLTLHLSPCPMSWGSLAGSCRQGPPPPATGFPTVSSPVVPADSLHATVPTTRGPCGAAFAPGAFCLQLLQPVRSSAARAALVALPMRSFWQITAPGPSPERPRTAAAARTCSPSSKRRTLFGDSWAQAP
jgi:hypothetical protein